MSLFYRDSKLNQEYTWDFLIEDLKKTKTFNPFCKSNNYYILFKNIIFSLLHDVEITLLDGNFTDEEVKSLISCTDIQALNKSFNNNFLFSKKNELIQVIKSQDYKKWSIGIFTSGTTGLPKKVLHDFKSITKFVKISENYKSHIWGMAYNPTHMAGIQVFFQALLNCNPIIRLFGLNSNEILNEVEIKNISHISATPTFYRLLSNKNKSINTVKRITFGGERFDNKAIEKIKNLFPEAKINNIYATTEFGSLFISSNSTFEIKKKYKDLVQIKNNELFVHKKIYPHNFHFKEEWVPTGDLVKKTERNPLKFEFLSRKSDIINIGGYKVNPSEIEAILNSHDDIKNCKVFSKSNSVTGNLICCEIIKKNQCINENDIIKFLETKIQNYKIPRIFNFVKELKLTRTGKIKR